MQREKIVQQQIVHLLQSLGAKVYVLGTRRSRGKKCPKCGTFVPEDQGTRQTPGIADVLAFLPRYPATMLRMEQDPHARRLLVVEAKAIDARGREGKASDEQIEFLGLCDLAQVDRVLGTLDAVIAWCVEHGYLLDKNVPHYRRPVTT